MKTAQFDYYLPPELIAQEPPPRRDAGRLLLLDRARRSWEDRAIADLPDLLRPGDLLVFNDTKVIPARLRSVREASGGQVEIFLLPPDEAELLPENTRGQAAKDSDGAAATGGGSPARTLRRVLTRSGGKLRPGETFSLPGGARATLLERLGEAGERMAFDVPPEAFPAYLSEHGEVPLPPYIRRPPGPSWSLDRERYQTVFAREPGAVAAPTAGLHFSPTLLDALRRRGVQQTFVTLHVGPGTFRSVKAEDVADHFVDPEPFSIGEEAARAVTRAKAEGRRVIPVGSTALRALETRWDAGKNELCPGAGQSGLFIRPPHPFPAADLLLTNFHLPKSSLLMLAAAFASPGKRDGIEFLLAAYEHAKRSGYRFFSYGDACLFV